MTSKPETYRQSRSAAAAFRDLLPLCDLVCLVCDFGWLILAASVSTLLYGHWLTPASATTGFIDEFNIAALVAAALAPFTLYDRRFGAIACRGETPALIRSYALRFTIFAAVILGLGGLSQVLEYLPRSWLAIWFTIGLLSTALTRVLVVRYLQYLQHRGVLTETIALVGAGPAADRLAQALRQSPPETVELLGVFDDGTDSLERLIELGKHRRIDWILLTLPPEDESRLQSIVRRLKALSVPIGMCPQYAGPQAPYITIARIGNDVPVNLLVDRPLSRWDAAIKEIEDVLIGGLLTVLLLPVLAFIAVAIKLDSPGPVLFKQRRHTLNNREFDVYKFRTMHWDPAANAAGLRQTSRHDPRVTRLGHFLRSSSLDELPQLFNVLKGDMSMVGPRPHAVDMRTEDQLGTDISEIYTHRHRVKAGITGWSQVNGARGATDTTAQLRHRVELDLQYIEQWSLLLDLKILVRTPREVIKGTNAF